MCNMQTTNSDISSQERSEGSEDTTNSDASSQGRGHPCAITEKLSERQALTELSQITELNDSGQEPFWHGMPLQDFNELPKMKIRSVIILPRMVYCLISRMEKGSL